MFIDILKAILFGIVEGITEWLPISSTGHMILLNEFVTLDVSPEFWDMFEVVIQLGAILAVVVLYFNRLNPFSGKKTAQEKKDTWSLWFRIIVAIIPSGIVGILLDDYISAHFGNYVVVAIALVVYGIAFIVIERTRKPSMVRINDMSQITYGHALLVGCFQILSLIPGTSRSGSTILGAMLFGMSRTAAAEFSFFMAIPTMAGASLVKIAKFAGHGVSVSAQEWVILAVGCAVAFAVSIAALKYLIDYVRKHSFSAFGVYRIILGALVLGYFLIVK
ncbi:MAG: undecaprenyl-diphosphate phosphatase [Eubacteriales bacterium]